MERKGTKDLLNMERASSTAREVFTASDTYDATMKTMVSCLPGYERAYAHKGAISGEA